MTTDGELGNPRILDRRHRELLAQAAETLTMEWLDDFCAARRSSDDHIPRGGSMADALPPKHWGRYTTGFAARFIATLHVVIHRLSDPEALEPYFNSTAEELAFAALIDLADVLADDADFATYRDLMTEDADIDLLWDMSLNGVEETDLGGITAPANLAFDRWFAPFRTSDEWTDPFGER